MIAAVTDLAGDLTGVQRTWLDPSGRGKATIDTPRRAMGHLLGHGVRLGLTTGSACDAMAAGEGIETMLSLRCIMTTLPMTAALSSAHLAALQLPPALRRLYIARDLDPAGHIATARLADRARDAGIEALVLSSRLRGFQRRSPPLRHRPSSGGLARAARARGFQPVCFRRIVAGRGRCGMVARLSRRAGSKGVPVLRERTAPTAF